MVPRQYGVPGVIRTRGPRFLTASAFAAAPRGGVRGLDYPFAMAVAGFRRRPSSLYTFPNKRAWLGISMAKRPKRSPTLSGYTPAFPSAAPNL